MSGHDTKRCPACAQDLPLDRFGSNRTQADGLQTECKPCRAQRARETYQDISVAGYGAGLTGERSGLWHEFARIIGEMGPPYVVVENVAALLTRGIDAVLGTLANLGYDAEWSTVSACAVGAPHVRQRVFIVAHANGFDGRSRIWNRVARPERPLQAFDGFADSRARWQARMADPSALYRNADGVPNRLERNRAIGNAVVPQVAELIGRRILAAHIEQEAVA